MSHRRAIRAAVFAVAATFVAVGTSPASAQKPRTTIAYFEYAGLQQPENAQAFEQFTEIIFAKLSRLAEELSGGGAGQGLSHVDDLKAAPITDSQGSPQPFRLTNTELLQLWQDSHHLEVLSGRVRTGSAHPQVRNRVFLGDLATPLGGSRFIDLDLAVRDREFDTTVDSLSVITLYALALDSRARCRPRHETMVFLNEAYKRLNDLPAQLPGRARLQVEIEKAIDVARGEENGQCS